MPKPTEATDCRELATDCRELTAQELVDVVGGALACDDPIRSVFRAVLMVTQVKCAFDPMACQC